MKHVGIFLKDEDDEADEEDNDKENNVDEALGRGARGQRLMTNKTRVSAHDGCLQLLIPWKLGLRV